MSWDANSKYFETWKYINEHHPRLQVYLEASRFSCEVKPFVNEDDMVINNLLEETNEVFNYTVDLIIKYGEVCSEYRNRAYSAAMREYSLNKYNNEVLLYFMVKCAFPDTLFQYRDDFLGNLSLDIYIPSKRFAIEYQGAQHYGSIAVFDGKDGLSERKKRDEQKQHICDMSRIKLCQWNYEIPINDYNVTKRLAAYLHMDFFEVRNLSRTGLSMIADNGWTGKDVLSWCSQLRYKRSKKLPPKSTSVKQYVIRKYNADGVFLSQYDSIEKASNEINVKSSTISKACRGIQVLAGGYQWRKCELESIPSNIDKAEEYTISSGPKPVYQITLDGEVVKRHESIKSASKEVGVDSKSIRAVLKGIQKKAGGFYWDYA